MKYQGYIQPIIIRKTGTHEQMVEAAARASVAAWLQDPENPAWKPWLAASFGKSVRRARTAEIDKCAEWVVASAKVGEAEAFACLPVLSDAMPAPIRRLQVSGTNAARGHWTKPDRALVGPYVTINMGAHMSTGKTCAQVAHGVFAWALKQDEATLTLWRETGLTLRLSECSEELFAYQRAYGGSRVVVIEDAGHTEVAPGTATVKTWVG